MKIYEERRPDLTYKETLTKVEVALDGVESQSVTKVVQKWKEFEIEYARWTELRKSAQEASIASREKKREYEEILRSLDEQYFNTVGDATKTKVIKTMSFLIKLSKKPETHESHTVDWEAVTNELVKLMDIPINVLQEAIKKHTEVELVIPKVRLFHPVPLVNGKPIKKKDEAEEMVESLNEGVSGWFNDLLNRVKKFYIKLLNQFQVFDSILNRLEEKYM